MEYPGEYAKELSDLISRIPAGFRSEELLVSENEMRLVLDTVFYAGLLHEEGRSIRVSVILIENSVAHSERLKNTLLFEVPQPLNPDSLRKLSPAIDPLYSALIVDRRSGDLVIVGIEHGVGMHKLPHTTIGRQGRAYFNVRSLFPGNLTVDIGSSCVLHFTAGVGIRYGLPGDNSDEIKHGIDPKWNGVGRETIDYIKSMMSIPNKGELDEGINSLFEISKIMREKRHGGTLLVAPGDPPTLILSEAGYCLDKQHRNIFLQAIREYRSLSPEGHTNIGNGSTLYDVVRSLRDLRSMLDFVASLTQIDGAVLLSPELSIMRIGAIIMGDEKLDDLKEIKCYNPLKNEETTGLERVGTRHRSAIRFCRAQPGPSIAFVASQDALATLIVGNGTDIYVIRPLPTW